MRPDYLVISAWGPYKDKVEIDFKKFQGKGLFLITGSTGAGKTTIFDAITYALYGTLSGDTREKGSVRSDFASGDIPTFVELTMTHGGKEYRICRNPEYLRPKKKKSGTSEWTKEKENAVIYLPDGKIIEGTKEVNAKMQEILVLAQEQFKQISMIAQGQFSKMLTAPARDKISIFREIFGTGVYEQFARNLRERSNALYVKAAEQRHKLEEDIRLLLDNAEYTTDVIAQKKDQLQLLTETDNWNYEAIRECLFDWQKLIRQLLEANEKDYAQTDAGVNELSAELARVQEQNRKISQWDEACKKHIDLIGQSSEIEKMRRILQKAAGAAQVKSKEEVWRALDLQKEKNNRRFLSLKEEIKILGSEKKALQKYYDCREKLEEYFALREQQNAVQEKIALQDKALREKQKEHQNAQELYVALELEREKVKSEYENADRARRHAAIGLAANMLVPGMPCPVCGSTEHPAPAKPAEGILSEEAIRQLKDEMEEKEQALLFCQEKTVSLFTQVQNLNGQKEELEKQYRELAKMCGTKEEEFVAADIKIEEDSAKQVRENVTRYDRVLGLIQSKTEEQKETAKEGKGLELQVKEAKEQFEETMRNCGFESEEEFHSAFLPETERSQMERREQKYREELAGIIALKEHLEQEVKGLTRVDETEVEKALGDAKEKKEEIRLRQEKISSLADRIKGTLSGVKEKQEKLEKLSTEYGYVKDLDNLASGNNKKRMVFEQYVLIGYFDEILRAANMRFSHMTGGRYEMSRMEETSDGRTKNSLEIEVMDYYTGKMRSVKTLSGGESFKASLALALGLSDVIQALNGGIKVEALFVDEGFGALDSESLDQACETLQGLVERNRMIGIISHVQELRERIDHQIVVERSSQGSKVKEILF